MRKKNNTVMWFLILLVVIGGAVYLYKGNAGLAIKTDRGKFEVEANKPLNVQIGSVVVKVYADRVANDFAAVYFDNTDLRQFRKGQVEVYKNVKFTFEGTKIKPKQKLARFSYEIIPVCGNQVREGTEDCDAPDDMKCPGRCSTPLIDKSCRCLSQQQMAYAQQASITSITVVQPQLCLGVVNPECGMPGLNCPVNTRCKMPDCKCEAGVGPPPDGAGASSGGFGSGGLGGGDGGAGGSGGSAGAGSGAGGGIQLPPAVCGNGILEPPVEQCEKDADCPEGQGCTFCKCVTVTPIKSTWKQVSTCTAGVNCPNAAFCYEYPPLDCFPGEICVMPGIESVVLQCS